MVGPAAAEGRRFWKRHRLPYNIALLVSGVLAGLAYTGALVAWHVWPPPPEEWRPDFFDLDSFLFVLAYAVGWGAANILYLLGPLAEILVRPRRADTFRRVVFALGTGFSVLLPWIVPVNAWREFVDRMLLS
jgi:hypothetical protein